MVGGRGLIRVEATMIEEIAAHFADLAELLGDGWGWVSLGMAEKKLGGRGAHVP